MPGSSFLPGGQAKPGAGMPVKHHYQNGSQVVNETLGEKAVVGSNPFTLQVQETQGKPPTYDDVTASATTQSPEAEASSKKYQRLVSID